jgi:hypothetical protein
MLTPEEQSAFVQSVENVQQAAATSLSTQRSGRSVVAFVRNLHQAVDRVVDAAVHRGELVHAVLVALRDPSAQAR